MARTWRCSLPGTADAHGRGFRHCWHGAEGLLLLLVTVCSLALRGTGDDGAVIAQAQVSVISSQQSALSSQRDALKFGSVIVDVQRRRPLIWPALEPTDPLYETSLLRSGRGQAMSFSSEPNLESLKEAVFSSETEQPQCTFLERLLFAWGDRCTPQPPAPPPGDQPLTFGEDLARGISGIEQGRFTMNGKNGEWRFAHASHTGLRASVPFVVPRGGSRPEVSLLLGREPVQVDSSLDQKSGELALQLPRSFQPGLYAMEVAYADAAGRRASVQQDFAWGVLAVNRNRDRYRPRETALFSFGVLDQVGQIVCNAALTLTLRFPDGSIRVLSTADGSITVSSTCGRKEAGLITPDYSAKAVLPLEGITFYDVVAVTGNDAWTVSGEIPVEQAPPVVVERTAATRLWPFAPSMMRITVRFRRDFSGSITEIIPQSFGILESKPAARLAVRSGADGGRTLTWRGSWKAGQTAELQYAYDAPNTSPDFFLLGPMEFSGVQNGTLRLDSLAQGPAIYTEARSWEIANDGDTSSSVGKAFFYFLDQASSAPSPYVIDTPYFWGPSMGAVSGYL